MSSSTIASQFIQHLTNCITKRDAKGIQKLYSSKSTFAIYDENAPTDAGEVKGKTYIGTDHIFSCISQNLNCSSIKINYIDSVTDEEDNIVISVDGEELVDVYRIPFHRTFYLVKINRSYHIKSEILRYKEKIRNTRKVVMTAGEAETLGYIPKSASKAPEPEQPKEAPRAEVASAPQVIASKPELIQATVVSVEPIAATKVSEPKPETEANVIQAIVVPPEESTVKKASAPRAAKKIITANVVSPSLETSASESQTPIMTPATSENKDKNAKPRRKATRPEKKKPTEKDSEVKSTNEGEIKQEVKPQVKVPTKPASWAQIVEPRLVEDVPEVPKIIKTASDKSAVDKVKNGSAKTPGKPSTEVKPKEQSKKPASKISSSTQHPERTLYISNIPSDLDSDTVLSHLVVYGALESHKPSTQRDGSSNFLFVTFESAKQAEDLARAGHFSIGKYKLKAELKRTQSNKDVVVRRHTANVDSGDGFVKIGKSKA